MYFFVLLVDVLYIFPVTLKMKMWINNDTITRTMEKLRLAQVTEFGTSPTAFNSGSWDAPAIKVFACIGHTT